VKKIRAQGLGPTFPQAFDSLTQSYYLSLLVCLLITVLFIKN